MTLSFYHPNYIISLVFTNYIYWPFSVIQLFHIHVSWHLPNNRLTLPYHDTTDILWCYCPCIKNIGYVNGMVGLFKSITVSKPNIYQGRLIEQYTWHSLYTIYNPAFVYWFIFLCTETSLAMPPSISFNDWHLSFVSISLLTAWICDIIPDYFNTVMLIMLILFMEGMCWIDKICMTV